MRKKQRLVAFHKRNQNLGMCPDQELNLLPFAVRGSAPGQVGQIFKDRYLVDKILPRNSSPPCYTNRSLSSLLYISSRPLLNVC